MTETASPHWLNDMTEDRRQLVYAQMRAEGETMTRYYNSPTQGGSGLAVGAASFDDVMKAEVRRDFLAALRKGMSPSAACDDAKARARGYVAKHNAQRTKDISWQRWEHHGADIADNLARVFNRIVKES